MKAVQQFGRHAVHLAHVNQAVPSDRFTAQVDVLSDGHLGNWTQFLVNHRNTLRQSIVGIGDVQFLTLETNGARIRAVDADQTLHQGGFSGPVLAHQGVDLTPAGIELDIAQSANPWELLGNTLHPEQVLVFHGLFLSFTDHCLPIDRQWPNKTHFMNVL